MISKKWYLKKNEITSHVKAELADLNGVPPPHIAIKINYKYGQEKIKGICCLETSRTGILEIIRRGPSVFLTSMHHQNLVFETVFDSVHF